MGKVIAFLIGAVLLITALATVGTYFLLKPAPKPPEATLKVKNQGDRLGSFTTIASTDRLTDFVAVYNANLGKTVETGTTSVSSITTLPNLVSVGTLTTGVWHGTPVTVPYGGTSSTTLSQYQVLVGNGTGIVQTAEGIGTNGQFLTSRGAGMTPYFTSASFDTTLDYLLTGGWTFPRATTTNATSTSLQVSGLASTSRMIVGALGVGVSTTTQRNAEIAGNLQVSGSCSGCVQMSTTSATASLGTSATAGASATASCTGGKHVIGGGYLSNPNSGQQVLAESRPMNSTDWAVTIVCHDTGTCSAGTLTVYALCTF